MKAKYNLALRINPRSIGDNTEKLWYAVPAGKGTLDEDETARLAVVDTTLSKGEYKHVMEVSGDKLMPVILSDIGVTIGKLGKLRLSFGSTGAAEIKDFNAQTMIKNAKIVFTPSKEMKEALAGATFELEGIIENGIKYGSVESYRKAKEETGGSGE